MFRLRCFFAFVALCAAALAMQAQDEMTATYIHHALEITVPYHGAHQGTGHLEVTLLSPEDKVLARSETVVKTSAASGVWQTELTPDRSLPFDDLVWERVRSRISFEGEQTPAIVQMRSVSTILRHPVVHLLGQTNYLAGAPAALRIIVTDGTPNAAHVPSGTVRIELAKQTAQTTLFTGKLDRRGTTNAEFRFPENLTGETSLRIIAETPLGTATTVETVHLEDRVSILLTTEKPIYQPSQTIHVRALTLDRADHHAAASRKITFELEDARGNRVFRKQTATDSFGVASAEFVLADEVNLGAWHLVSLLSNDEASPADTAEVTLQVQRYVLPKFRVSINFTQKDGRPQRDFRPGDHVTGTIEANYFFGKPVSNATINLKATGMDATVFNAAKSEGHTDAEGKYIFNLTLPTYFAARSSNQGAAPVVVEAAVTDSAGHTETHDEPITVSESPLLIQAVPEGGQLVPSLDNTVYIITSFPDGSPAQTTVHLRTKAKADRAVDTGENGIAVTHLQGSPGNDQLRCDADDHHGRRASASLHLQARDGEDQLLLHTDYAVYRPGQTMKLEVVSTHARATAYVDIIKDGQTILTRDVDLNAGHAGLSIPVTSTLSGTIELNAYIFGSNSAPVQDHRFIFVQPAQDLHIEAHADRASYLPGADARVSFHVTDSHGKGVEAALGFEVVDEAVFALAEKRPGFAKVFFYLEQELMKPRFEINSLSPGEIVAEPNEGGDEHEPVAQDQAARVLFSAAESINPHTLDTTFGDKPPDAQRYVFASRYMEVLSENASLLAHQLHDQLKNRAPQNIEQVFSSLRDSSGTTPHDAWNTPLRLERTYWSGNRYFRIVSAGPDRRFGTEDDLAVIIDLTEGGLFMPGVRGAIAVKIEHDRGPFNGLAQVIGTVVDPSGADVNGAQVRLEALNNGEVRHAIADHVGAWAFVGLPAGAYRISISSPGFMSATQTLTVAARDQAVLRATLYIGAVNEAVEVMAAPGPALATEAVVADRVLGRFSAGVAATAKPTAQFALRAVALKAPTAPDTQTEAHTRSYFPEALFIDPEIITDNHGNASASFPVADSITTWRMAMFASTRNGALGSAVSSLKVFQDFFVDLDLPYTITQGDRISIPVAIYNYTDKPGDVQLQLQPDNWFDLPDSNPHKDVNARANAVSSSSFIIQAKHIGRFKLTLAAHMGDRQDTAVREIDVVPDGQPREIVFNGRLDGGSQSATTHTVSFPAATLPESTTLFVRLYPGPLSQIAEGMDGVLRMPFGCFEQTSSSTYPNVLAHDYMKHSKRITPEIRAKAEGFIATGYQRLLSFEVPGGGFSWFGQAPANKILTAYGLMEFYDMSKVHDVDPRVIERTRDWLIAQQQPDGSWKPDTEFINEGATNRFNSDVVRITAYIAWSLEVTNYNGPALDRARTFLRAHIADSTTKLDAYTLAVLANFAVDSKADQEWAHEILGRLLSAAHTEGDQLWWTSDETGVYATGSSAAVETTGLAVQALLISGEQNAAARKALTWLLSKKNGDGNWGSTQATIMALRALVMASEKSGGDALGDVEILLDGQPFKTISLTRENNDLLQQFALPAKTSPRVELRFHGTGGLAYQVDGRYFVPWGNRESKDALSIDVTYDRTHLAESDMVSATATIRNNLNKQANMVMVDLGIPPGFDLQTEDLQSMVESTAHARTGRLEKFNLTATQAILYFNSVGVGETVKVRFRFRAKYPIRAKAFASRVYEYYDPSVSATTRPATFEVTAR